MKKIVIKLSDTEYNQLIYGDDGLDYEVLEQAVINGTPISDNATNGDVIKAFYPELVVGLNNLGKTIFLRPNATVVIEDRMSDWWNALYQKGE